MQQVFGHHDDADATVAWEEYGGQPPEIEQSTGLPRWALILMVVSMVLMLITGLALIGNKLLMDRYAGSAHHEHLLGGAAARRPADGKGPGHARTNGALNLLLAGIDGGADDPAGGPRADTIMIVHIPAGHDRAYLISVPRDSRVGIPVFRKTGYPGGVDKINAAFSFGYNKGGGRSGGFELLALAIKQLTGISFDAGTIIDIAGLQSVVDAIGGAELCVDEETPVPAGPVYHVGCQNFSGPQALEYVRQRKPTPDGDYGRQRHQQQLLTALVTKIGNDGMLADPFTTDRTLRSLGNAVTFDGNGVSLSDWVVRLKGIAPENIKLIAANGGQYTTQVIDGQDFEILTDTSRELFTAIHGDSLDHCGRLPGWPARSSGKSVSL
jgi:LCP family protein required for cell wall assembly